MSDIANPGDGTVAKHALTGYATLNDVAKFELTRARGQQRRVAVALISSCELTDTGSASQPALKSFGMDKMQLLEPEMEPKKARTLSSMPTDESLKETSL